jgi:cytochrome c551
LIDIRLSGGRYASFFSGIILVLATSCSGPGKETSDPQKYKRYYIKGEQLYAEHCANCHQDDGKGLGQLYPPIANSDFIQSNKNRIGCLIRYGLTGEIIVNGKTYNKEMPAMPALTDLEIAQILTYIFNKWENGDGLTDVKDVSARLNDCTKQ